MLLHNPIETPKIAAFGMIIEPGKETRILIRPNIFVASANLQSISLKKRKCYFPHERSLRFYRTYTQKNCQRECEANFTLEMCRCVEQYMPSKLNETATILT